MIEIHEEFKAKTAELRDILQEYEDNLCGIAYHVGQEFKPNPAGIETRDRVILRYEAVNTVVEFVITLAGFNHGADELCVIVKKTFGEYVITTTFCQYDEAAALLIRYSKL